MTETLATALATLQADLPHVAKNRTAKVQTKTGGEYSYKYADLNDVATAIHPLMSKVGLSFSALPTTTDDGRFVLRYQLRHTAGEIVEGEYPLPDPEKNTPQQIGSALTYARRYVLSAVTGVVPDEDDDGQVAQQTTAKKAERIRRPATPPVDEWTAPEGVIPPTPPVTRKTDREWFDDWLGRVVTCGNLDDLKNLWSECNNKHREGKVADDDFTHATKAKNEQKAALEQHASESAA